MFVLSCLTTAAQEPRQHLLSHRGSAKCRLLPLVSSAEKPLPELGRIGVDMDRQRPLSLREALALALENNKDIEVARQNVKIAEFDLTAARAFTIRVSVHLHITERTKSPISSFLSGGSNGATTQSDYTGTAGLRVWRRSLAATITSIFHPSD